MLLTDWPPRHMIAPLCPSLCVSANQPPANPHPAVNRKPLDPILTRGAEPKNMDPKEIPDFSSLLDLSAGPGHEGLPKNGNTKCVCGIYARQTLVY